MLCYSFWLSCAPAVGSEITAHSCVNIVQREGVLRSLFFPLFFLMNVPCWGLCWFLCSSKFQSTAGSSFIIRLCSELDIYVQIEELHDGFWMAFVSTYWPNVWSLFQTALTRWRHWSAPGSPCDFYHHWSCNCCQRPYAQWVSGGHFFHTLPVSKGQVLFGGSTMENRSGQREGYWNSAQWRVNIVLRVHLIYMCSEYLLNARMSVCCLICARV